MTLQISLKGLFFALIPPDLRGWVTIPRLGYNKSMTNSEQNQTPDYDDWYDFEEGISMPYEDSKDHYAEWQTGKSYYVKCSDKYDNQPAPSSCSIIIRSSPII